MWLNGINMNEVAALSCNYTSGSGGVYHLEALWPNTWSYTGPNNTDIKDYGNPTDFATDVESFVNQAGYPWLIVGTIPLSSAQSSLVAVNLNKILSFGDSSPAGNGVVFNEFGGAAFNNQSNGYAPWANYAAARAAILALVGDKEI